MRMSEAELGIEAVEFGKSESVYFHEQIALGYITGYRKALADLEAWVDVETILRDLLNRIGSEERNGYVKFNAVDEIIEEVIAFNKPPPKQAEAANE